MNKDGRYIPCPVEKSSGRMVSRVTCLVQPYEDCPYCRNSRFALRFPENLGRQVVLCPRWNGNNHKQAPDYYVPIERVTCISERPFTFCGSCPNRIPGEPPRDTEGWVEDPVLRRITV